MPLTCNDTPYFTRLVQHFFRSEDHLSKNWHVPDARRRSAARQGGGAGEMDGRPTVPPTRWQGERGKTASECLWAERLVGGGEGGCRMTLTPRMGCALAVAGLGGVVLCRQTIGCISMHFT